MPGAESPDRPEELAIAERAQSATIAALRRAAAYPEPTEAIETIETHRSWVFLTSAHAYKLKKALRTRFFDHATLAGRRVACDAELRLNRRLSHDVYLDVVPVTGNREGVRVGGTGAPIEWLVKMRRLPRERMLDAQIARNRVRVTDVRAVAAELSDFYRRAEPANLTPRAYRERLRADVKAKRASLTDPRYGLDARLAATAAGALRDWLEARSATVQGRAAAVVDAHGDLRPEHICLEHPPSVIDCLDFSRDLRLLDPASELSFFALECARLRAPVIGDWAWSTYASRTGDRVPEDLLRFYRGYHACVRAAVSVWHLDDGDRDDAARWQRRATWYLRHAVELLS